MVHDPSATHRPVTWLVAETAAQTHQMLPSDLTASFHEIEVGSPPEPFHEADEMGDSVITIPGVD